MNMGPKGMALLRVFEGFRCDAYPDPATRGEPYTIGYGHTSAAGSPEVHRGLRITPEQGEEILQRDLMKYENAVEHGMTRKPNQNQFDAMVSLCYNIGPGNFKKSSVLRYFNENRDDKAANAFLSWNKAAGHVMAGLIRRRQAEADLYMETA
jgi:lysozyme